MIGKKNKHENYIKANKIIFTYLEIKLKNNANTHNLNI
jgi:hypothetical protein